MASLEHNLTAKYRFRHLEIQNHYFINDMKVQNPHLVSGFLLTLYELWADFTTDWDRSINRTQGIYFEKLTETIKRIINGSRCFLGVRWKFCLPSQNGCRRNGGVSSHSPNTNTLSSCGAEPVYIVMFRTVVTAGIVGHTVWKPQEYFQHFRYHCVSCEVWRKRRFEIRFGRQECPDWDASVKKSDWTRITNHL